MKNYINHFKIDQMFSILSSRKATEYTAVIIQTRSRYVKTTSEIGTDLVYISSQMRKNISRGVPVLDNILEKIGKEDNDYSAALFTEIFLQELRFCHNTIRLIMLISQRYHEEQIADQRDADGDNDYDYVETLPMTNNEIRSGSSNAATEFLIGSHKIYTRFQGLITNLGPGFSIPFISSQHTQDSCWIRLFDRFKISIVTVCSPVPSTTHGQFIGDFNELYEISRYAWNIMAVIAFSNLFRFIEHSWFETNPINPDQAIFSNQGQPFPPFEKLQVCEVQSDLRKD
jgi:hypothetical protein